MLDGGKTNKDLPEISGPLSWNPGLRTWQSSVTDVIKVWVSRGDELFCYPYRPSQIECTLTSKSSSFLWSERDISRGHTKRDGTLLIFSLGGKFHKPRKQTLEKQDRRILFSSEAPERNSALTSPSSLPWVTRVRLLTYKTVREQRCAVWSHKFLLIC